MFEVTTDTSNKDVPSGMTRHQAKDYYLKLYGSEFQSKLPNPIDLLEPYGDKFVIRFDKSPAGFKAFAAEKLIAECPKDTLVYVAPRVGHAPQAIAELAQRYNKKCVFFVPASKEVSKHQAVLAAYGADLRFVRTAAMPMLNIYAKRWAEERGAQYLSFGLSGMPQVTAGIVKMASMIPEPEEFWCAVSTGTMVRGLQIGWPNSQAMGLAVARNIHTGEIGDAIVESAKVPFLRPVKYQELPDFPTTATYDAKAFVEFNKRAKPGAYFINVGADAEIERYYSQVDVSKIDSKREWNDLRDMLR